MFKNKENCRCDWLPPVARLFLSVLFIVSGIAKVFNFEGTAGYIASVGLPFPEVGVVVAILIEVLGGLSILLGFKIYWGANILALYTLTIAFFFHREFSDQAQMVNFMKNLAIAGGLLYTAHFGAGKWSFDNKSSSSPNEAPVPNEENPQNQ